MEYSVMDLLAVTVFRLSIGFIIAWGGLSFLGEVVRLFDKLINFVHTQFIRRKLSKVLVKRSKDKGGCLCEK